MKNKYKINGEIYITNSAPIKVGEWCFELYNGNSLADAPKFIDQDGTWWLRRMNMNCDPNSSGLKKIILTTDLMLINEGIQCISTDFLVWFGQNPDCEEINIAEKRNPCNGSCGICDYSCRPWYEIIIPEIKTKTITNEKGGIEIDLTTLCYYDRRNPDFNITEENGYDEEEIEATGNFAKKDCYCDNCFYGRTELTEQLIEMSEIMYTEEEVLNLMLVSGCVVFDTVKEEESAFDKINDFVNRYVNDYKRKTKR